MKQHLNHLNLGLFDGTESAPAEQSDTTTDAVETTPTTRKQREFRALIAGQYKEEYAAATRHMLDKRFKHYKAMEADQAALQPMVTALHGYFGTDTPDSLLSAMKEHYRSSAAAREQTLAALRKLRAVREGFGIHLAAEAQLRDWQSQAERVRQLYGDFDLVQAAADPAFLAMLKAGVSMDKAWMALNMPALYVHTAVPAPVVRPPENGNSGRSGLLPGRDVSRMSRDQRAELARRSMKGETIRL